MLRLRAAVQIDAGVDWLAVFVAAVMVALSIAAWGTVAGRLRAGQPIVPLATRRPVPWRVLDLLLIVAFYVLANRAFWAISSLIASAADGTHQGDLLPQAGDSAGPTDLAIGLSASIAANLATTVFALLWIFSHTDASWADLGWRRETVRGDVWLGLVAFAAIAAPIYGLQALLSQFVSEKHPIIEILTERPTGVLYVLAGLSAVIVAPLAEEFFFRVLLQGRLESTGAATQSTPAASAGPAEYRPKPSAIVVTSLVFALLHLGHGAAPIPLFFLALALGYLYQRTHRLAPSVTVHFCLNACSFAVLCLGPPKG